MVKIRATQFTRQNTKRATTKELVMIAKGSANATNIVSIAVTEKHWSDTVRAKRPAANTRDFPYRVLQQDIIETGM
jgi:hypothetical protein